MSFDADKVRVDKWLWAARMFKTRSMATAACDAGHVKLNGQSSKASKMLKIGDTLDVVTPGGKKNLEVVALHDKRGPASVARELYLDHTPPEPPKVPGMQDGIRDRGAGRPSKRDRRDLNRLKGGWS